MGYKVKCNCKTQTGSGEQLIKRGFVKDATDLPKKGEGISTRLHCPWCNFTMIVIENE